METNIKRSYKEASPRNAEGATKVSLDKAHSPFKVLSFPELIRAYAAGEKVHPLHIRMGITNRCNLRCNFCNFHSSNEESFYDAFNYNDTLETAEVIHFLSGFYRNGGRAVTFCGSGECTVHSGYKEISYQAKEEGLFLGLITNGTMFGNRDMLDCIAKTHTWVRIGLNAGTAASYSRIMNFHEAAFTHILDAVPYLRQHAVEKDFKIGLNFVVTLENCHEILKAAQLAKAANAHYIRYEPEFYTALAHDTIYQRIDEINQLFAEVKKLEDSSFEVSIPKFNRGPMINTDTVEGDFRKCHYSHFVTALGADGYMYPCPQIHLGMKYRMGSAVEQGYEAWVHSGQKEAWEEENSDRTEYCKTCFYRPQNELLEWIVNGSLDLEQVIEEYNRDNEETLHRYFV
jgi:radical SAM protein with 4Fe4S-binding SPASM domain